MRVGREGEREKRMRVGWGDRKRVGRGEGGRTKG